MGCSVRHAIVLGFLVLEPALMAQTPRRPRGIYAKVNIASEIDQNRPAAESESLQLCGRCLQSGFHLERPKSGAAPENHPAHRDAGLSDAPMGLGSDSFLQWAVSVARSDSSRHVRKGDLRGLQRSDRRHGVSAAVEPLL